MLGDALHLMTGAVSECFHALDEQLLATSRREKTREGCTAVIGLIMGALGPAWLPHTTCSAEAQRRHAKARFSPGSVSCQLLAMEARDMPPAACPGGARPNIVQH